MPVEHSVTACSRVTGNDSLSVIDGRHAMPPLKASLLIYKVAELKISATRRRRVRGDLAA